MICESRYMYVMTVFTNLSYFLKDPVNDLYINLFTLSDIYIYHANFIQSRYPLSNY